MLRILCGVVFLALGAMILYAGLGMTGYEEGAIYRSNKGEYRGGDDLEEDRKSNVWMLGIASLVAGVVLVVGGVRERRGSAPSPPPPP